MKARYSASGNTLKEISQMEKPVKPKMGLAKSSFEGAMEKYTKQLAAYEKHVASLRTLPCHPSCKTVWKEGDVLTEGKDYEVKECRTWTKREDYGWGCSECCNKDAGCDEDCDSNYYRPNCPFCKGKGWFKEQPLFAYPIPVNSEDDLWNELVKEGFIRDTAIEGLRKTYTLTKKQ